jgi:hypothetical protein
MGIKTSAWAGHGIILFGYSVAFNPTTSSSEPETARKLAHIRPSSKLDNGLISNWVGKW